MPDKKSLSHKYVTLLVMFDAVSDPKSFRLKTSTLRFLTGALVVFSVVLIGSLIYYFSFAYKVFYYDELERKYQQLAEDNLRIKTIEREYRKVKQENEKIRIVFGLLRNPPPKDTTREAGSSYENFTSAKEMGYYPGKDLNDPLHERMAESFVDQESKIIAGDYITFSRVVPSILPVNSRFVAREFKGPKSGDPFSTKPPHIGVDIVAEEGAPVKASAEGWVVIGEWLADYGNTIVLYHGFGYFSVYKHLQYTLVEPNSFVRGGEVIGTVGKTGRLASGTHLHFEIWRDGAPQDPSEFIPALKEALRVTRIDSLSKK